MDWISVIIMAVVAVALLVGVVMYIYRKNNPKVSKAQGRDAGGSPAVAAAKRWARSNDYRVIAPLRLAGKNSFANIDALVIGYFGILGVKGYGYNGDIYGGANEAQWLQVAGDGNRTNFPNPITEAAADVRVVRDALLAAKIRQVPVEVVCVFTNPKAQLALPKSTGHYTLRGFKDLIDKEKYREDGGYDLDKLEAAIRANIVTE